MSRIVDEPYFTYNAYNALTSGIQVKCPKCHGTGMVTADDDNAYFRCLSSVSYTHLFYRKYFGLCCEWYLAQKKLKWAADFEFALDRKSVV